MGSACCFLATGQSETATVRIMSTQPGPAYSMRVPGPRGLPLLGMAPWFRRDPLIFLRQLARDYGDIAQFRLMKLPVFLFNHPDYIRELLITRQSNFIKSRILQRSKRLLGEGLLTSEGEHHLRQRRLVQPAFYRERLQSYAAIMAGYAARARDRWQAGAELDMQSEMMRLTLAIVAKTLFSADVEGDAQAVGHAMSDVIDLFRFMTLPYSELLDDWPLPHKRRFERAKAIIEGAVYRIIRERRACGDNNTEDHKGDLLSTLLAVRDEDGSGMTDQQLRDEILTLFIAGHETTAIALTWTWYLLAQSPECEQRLHNEVDSVLCGSLPGFDDVSRLPYTEMVIAESLRLYPPAWAISRIAKESFAMGGFTIPKGAVCIVSPYVTQRDARFFPDPDRFEPERWRPEFHETRPKFSYFPFGGGTRVCVGERFAWTEMILVLATLAQRWVFSLASSEPVEARPLLTLRPRGGVRMIVRSL
jgi:cytochrome P450